VAARKGRFGGDGRQMADSEGEEMRLKAGNGI